MGDLLKRNSFINLEVCVLADYVKSLMNKGYYFKKFLLIQLEISKSCSCTMLLRNVLVVIGLAVGVEFQKFALLVTTLSYSGFVTRIALPMKFEYDISFHLIVLRDPAKTNLHVRILRSLQTKS